MNEDCLNAQGVGHTAGNLSGRSAEADQGKLGGIEPYSQADLFDRIGHGVDGHRQKSVGHRFHRHRAALCRDLCRQFSESGTRESRVEWRLAILSKDGRQEVWPQTTERHMTIRHCKRSAAAITGWTGDCAGRVRANRKASIAIPQD